MSDETTPLIFGDAAVAELGPSLRSENGSVAKRKSRPSLTHCENCGAALTGPYCAQCGQPAIDYRRSFGSLLADAADAFFNFDARFFQSFGLLLFKPWRLTNEFVEGKRARHVHPLRVYLIASVMFFLVINFLSKEHAPAVESKRRLIAVSRSLRLRRLRVRSRAQRPTPHFSLGMSTRPSPTAATITRRGESFLRFDGDERQIRLRPLVGEASPGKNRADR